MPTSNPLPTDRPAELAAFALLAPAAYLLLAGRLRGAAAAALALGVALTPLTISHRLDGRPESGDLGDHHVDGPLPQSPDPDHEHHELGHC